MPLMCFSRFFYASPNLAILINKKTTDLTLRLHLFETKMSKIWIYIFISQFRFSDIAVTIPKSQCLSKNKVFFFLKSLFSGHLGAALRSFYSRT